MPFNSQMTSEKGRELFEIVIVLKEIGLSKDEIKKTILEYLLK